MAETAFQIQYRQEFIAGFEQRQSLIRDVVTTEAVIKGNQATFLVADSGGATAVTRGVNGLIPARADNLNQPVATLAEKHDLVRKTGFNIFASQGDQKRIMQETTMAVINRDIDETILAELANATQDAGAAATMSLNLFIHARTILANNSVRTNDGNTTFLASPAALGYLMQTPEFTSADWVETKPAAGGRMAKWFNINIIEHENLVGVGTAAEICYMFHKAAIGHAVDRSGIQNFVGYDEEQDYSYARHSLYHGAKLLQNIGVVKITHDGSGFAAT